MLYKHFPSKHALFAAVLTDATEAMKDMVDALMAASPCPMAGMLALAERAAGDPLIIETIRLRTLAASLVDDPEVLAALEASLNEVLQRMAMRIAAGQAAGEVRTDIDPRMAAWILYGYTLAGGHAHAVTAAARCPSSSRWPRRSAACFAYHSPRRRCDCRQPNRSWSTSLRCALPCS